MVKIDEDADAASLAGGAFDQPGVVEIEDHLVDGWRGDTEVFLHVNLGGRAAACPPSEAGADPTGRGSGGCGCGDCQAGSLRPVGGDPHQAPFCRRQPGVGPIRGTAPRCLAQAHLPGGGPADRNRLLAATGWACPLDPGVAE